MCVCVCVRALIFICLNLFISIDLPICLLVCLLIRHPKLIQLSLPLSLYIYIYICGGGVCVLYTLLMNINGHVPYLIYFKYVGPYREWVENILSCNHK